MRKPVEQLEPGDLIIVVHRFDGWVHPHEGHRPIAHCLETIVSRVPNNLIKFLCVSGTYNFYGSGGFEVISSV